MDQTGASAQFQPRQFPFVGSQDVIEVLDAGRAYNGGSPPETDSFRRRGSAQSAQERTAAIDSRRRAKGVVPGPAARFEGNLEALGQFGRHARLAHGLSKPAG